MLSDNYVKGIGKLLLAIMPTDVRWHCIVESLSVCPQSSAKCYINVAPNQLITSESQLLAAR
jgi:hypothetical protein